MAGEANKVQFNIKNVYYAKQIVDESGKITFETPVHVPGAVNLNLEQQGDIEKFYADGIVFYQAPQNNGYQGDLEMAKFPDQMLIDIWGFTMVETDKVLLENANAVTNAFALLYQIDGDKSPRCYCMYNCTGTRPALGGATNTETKTPQTKSSTISAVPLADGRILAKTTKDSTQEVLTNWFKKVYEPPTTE